MPVLENNRNARHYAIVGAGLIGRLMAWRLLEVGHRISLFDKDPLAQSQSAGIVAAAMLAPISEVMDTEPVIYTQGKAGLAVWQTWIQSLNQNTAVHTELRLTGSVVVSHREDNGDYQKLLARLNAHESIPEDAVKHLDNQQLQTLEPELAGQFSFGCYLEEEGCIDNLALFEALAQRIADLGGAFQQAELKSLDADRLPEQLCGFDQVIDCRGFGAREDVQRLRGVRGEVIRVSAPEVNLSRPVRLVHPRYKLYIAPKPDHEYIIGATQIESENEDAMTVRSSLELLSALYSVHTGFAEAHILSLSARCRPAFDDNLPRIDKFPGLMSINGLYRHGYLLSPSVVLQGLYELGIASSAPWPDIVNPLSAHQATLTAV